MGIRDYLRYDWEIISWSFSRTIQLFTEHKKLSLATVVSAPLIIACRFLVLSMIGSQAQITEELIWMLSGGMALIVVGVAYFTWGIATGPYRLWKRDQEKIKELTSTNSHTPLRITMIELRNQAEELGWVFHTQETTEPLDFIDALQQAGSDGVIQFWGRENDTGFDDITRRNVLIKIPESYWIEHHIDFAPLLEAVDNFNVKTINYDMRGKAQYFDIQAGREAALKWLARESLTYRGRYEASQNGNG